MEGLFLNAVCASMVIVGLCDCFVVDGGSAASAQSDHDEILRLQSLVTKLNGTLSLHLDQWGIMEQRFRDLESKFRTMQGVSSETTSDVGTLQQITSILQSDLSSTKQQLAAMSLQNLMLNQTIQDQISSLSTNLTSFQQSETNMSKQENHLHFTAKRPPNTIPNKRDLLKFSNLESSSPVSSYDISTGAFTAPWKGVYWFALTLSAQSSSHIDCYIMKINTGRNVRVLGAVIVGIQGNLTTTTQVVESLDMGHRIIISACSGTGHIDPWQTTFSGVYLYAT